MIEKSSYTSNRKRYLIFLKEALEVKRVSYEGQLEAAKNTASEKAMFSPLNFICHQAVAEAKLFAACGDQEALSWAVRMYTDFIEFIEELPQLIKAKGNTIDEDFHVLGWIFEPLPFLKGYEVVRKYLSQHLIDLLEPAVERSINRIFTFPEYGAQNRVAMRAANLLSAAYNLPDSSYAEEWRIFGNRLLDENLGKWSIEDAGTYNPIWLSVLMEACKYANREDELYRHPITRYYAEYNLQLISPFGVIPEYGDGRWGSGWCITCSTFEKFASVYQDERYKWAATQVFESMAPICGPTNLTRKTLEAIADAFEWADDSIPEMQPSETSCEVLEHIVGKKIVFRSGWDPHDTYMLVNYKDETDVAFLPKHNMNHSINTHPEKTHHGHSDENAIPALLSGGSILLHDGGYRDGSHAVVSGREWRADFYHNNLTMRSGIIHDDKSFLEFCKNDGDYHPVRTEKIYFYNFEELDVSRTRRIDQKIQMEHDRCIHYLKEENLFVVIDFVRAIQTGSFTFGTHYYTEQCKKVSDHSFMTSYQNIATDEIVGGIPNDSSNKLLVTFPVLHQLEVEEISRSYTIETCMVNYVSRYMKQNEYFPIVTILTPCTDSFHVDNFEKSLKVTTNERGASVTLEMGGKKIVIGCRADLDAKIADLNYRPSYTYENGKTAFDYIDTDAYTVYTADTQKSFYYSFVDGTRIDKEGKNVFQVGAAEHLQKNKEWSMEISSWPCGEKRILKD